VKPHVKVDVTAGTLAAMTDEQFRSLRDHILAEGRWDTVETVRVDGAGDYVGVYLPTIFIGIEKDGYTHS
jgi:hypothetical protein